MIARREVYVGMKRKKAGSTCTWSGVMARIMRKSYTLRKRSHARPVRRLEKPQEANRLPCTSKSDRLPEKASNSCSTLKVRRSRREIWRRDNWVSYQSCSQKVPVTYLPCLYKKNYGSRIWAIKPQKGQKGKPRAARDPRENSCLPFCP